MTTIRSTFRSTTYFNGEEGSQKIMLNERNGRFYVETAFQTIYGTKCIERAITRFEKEAQA